MNKQLEAEVYQRAGGRCEYCQLSEFLSELPHVIDHIIARQHRGGNGFGEPGVVLWPMQLVEGAKPRGR